MSHGIHSQLADYFRAYGGWRALGRSPFLWLAIGTTFVTSPTWIKENWWADVISIIPGLLGVSLAAFTLFLSSGSEDFRKVIAGRAPGDLTASPYIKTASIFLHFLVVQVLALIGALLARSAFAVHAPKWFHATNEILRPVAWAFGYFLFLYALMVVLAASLGVYEVIRWYDDYVTSIKEDESHT